MNTDKLSSFVSATDKVILFDGVCKLCNAWSNFIIKNDKHRFFKLCSVQSEECQAILLHFVVATTLCKFGKSNVFS